jgi:hypothetical protein
MTEIDKYHRAVETGHEDQLFIDKCDDPTAGINSDDMDKLYPALGDVVQDVIDYFQLSGGEMPVPQSLPMAEVG